MQLSRQGHRTSLFACRLLRKWKTNSCHLLLHTFWVNKYHRLCASGHWRVKQYSSSCILISPPLVPQDHDLVVEPRSFTGSTQPSRPDVRSSSSSSSENVRARNSGKTYMFWTSISFCITCIVSWIDFLCRIYFEVSAAAAATYTNRQCCQPFTVRCTEYTFLPQRMGKG